MARNGSGTYTFPASEFKPAVSGGTLTAASWNTLTADIETAISDSIARDGQTATTARIPFASGVSATGTAVSAVAYGNTSDPNTGMYFSAADNVGIAAGGVAVLTATSSALTLPIATTVSGTMTFSTDPIIDGVAPSGSTFDVTYGNEVGTIDLNTERTAGNLGSLRFYGDDDGATTTNYGAITSFIDQNTAGAEYARLDFKAMRNGVLTAGLIYRENTTDVAEIALSSTENGNININSSRSANGSILGYFQFKGQDSGANTTTYSQITGAIISNTDTAEAGKLEFRTTQAGAEGDRMHVQNGAYMEGATGTDQGAGTFNATAVYDDGVLLSCYPFDQHLDGSIDLAKWDSKVPDREWGEQVRTLYKKEKEEQTVTIKKTDDLGITTSEDVVIEVEVEKEDGHEVVKAARTESREHDGARKFAARIGTEYDPLTTDGYAKHWKEKRHLTALPNEANFDPVNGKLSTGEWLQRLVETVETQAILIEELNQRIKVLEG